MKTEYEYIEFSPLVATGKTSKWLCRNRNDGDSGALGEVKWYGAWRQYCYFPTVQAVYSSGCLNDIMDFLKQLNTKNK